jgi:hypothetical protein
MDNNTAQEGFIKGKGRLNKEKCLEIFEKNKYKEYKCEKDNTKICGKWCNSFKGPHFSNVTINNNPKENILIVTELCNNKVFCFNTFGNN